MNQAKAKRQEMVDAINVSTNAVQVQLKKTPENQTPKSNLTKPTKVSKRKQLFKDKKGGKRARTVLDPVVFRECLKKERAAAERRAKEAEQATSKSAFKSQGLNTFQKELLQTSVEKVFSSSASEVSSNVGSGSDSDDDDDAQEEEEEEQDANVGGDEPTQLPSDDDDDTGMPEGTQVVDLSEDSDDEDLKTQVEEDDDAQEREQDVEHIVDNVVDAQVLKKYSNKFNVDANELYEFARLFATGEEIEAYMKGECEKDRNDFSHFISSMVTPGGENDHPYGVGLMVIFMAELLKDIDGRFTGIQNAYNQTCGATEHRVKQMIRAVDPKSEQKKGINVFVAAFLEKMGDDVVKFQRDYKEMFSGPKEQMSINSMLGHYGNDNVKFDELKMALNYCNNKHELNVLTFFPLQDLVATIDEKSLRLKYREENARPIGVPLNEDILRVSHDKDKLFALINKHKQMKEEYDREENEMVEKARKNASNECFLETLLFTTMEILSCCEKATEKSWEAIQKKICFLAKEFEKRRKAAPENVQLQVRLAFNKLSMYQNMFANEKCKLKLGKGRGWQALCFNAAIETVKQNRITFRRPNEDDMFVEDESDSDSDESDSDRDESDDDKKVREYEKPKTKQKIVLYRLIRQETWGKRVKGLQLSSGSSNKGKYLPPPILTVNEEVTVDKRFKHFFAVLHMASMSHCLMDSRACYHDRYYHSDAPEESSPVARLNHAFALLSEVFLKPSDLKKKQEKK